MNKKCVVIFVLLIVGLFVISGCSGPVGKPVQTGKLEGSIYTAGPGEKLVLDAEYTSNLMVLKETSLGGGIYQIDMTVKCGGSQTCQGNDPSCGGSIPCVWESTGPGLMSCSAPCPSECPERTGYCVVAVFSS